MEIFLPTKIMKQLSQNKLDNDVYFEGDGNWRIEVDAENIAEQHCFGIEDKCKDSNMILADFVQDVETYQ